MEDIGPRALCGKDPSQGDGSACKVMTDDCILRLESTFFGDEVLKHSKGPLQWWLGRGGIHALH